jgi:ABC-type Zn uptake system ZnuABC Zn-binding protein ZnuA
VIQKFPGKEPGSEYIKKLIDTIKQKNVKIIFTEPQFSPKIVNVLKNEL